MSDLVSFLNLMVNEEASDLYLSTGAPINIKVEGVTRPLTKSSLPPTAVKQLAYAVMNDNQKKDFEANLEANFAISVTDLGRFRVNVFYQRGEVAMVVRYLKAKIPSIEQLNLPLVLKELIMEPRGLVLIVGSTGSGKSTSLAAMIEHRNQNSTGHILSIEDPIEYIHKHKKSIINQREVGLDTLSYANALKNAMREAPDVIMIGEIRDQDTMRHAIAYADTGHLCISTLHANNAYQALERIVNFFPTEARKTVLDDLALNIKGIFSQRLMVSTDGKRIPAVEVMLPSPYIVDLIQKGELESVRDSMEHARDTGMQTFEQSVFELYIQGKVSKEEALKSVDSKGNLQTRIRLAEGTLGDSGSIHMDNEVFR